MVKGMFAAPTWDGKNPVIPCAGWDAAQAWRNFDDFITSTPEVLKDKNLEERFFKLKPCFKSRRKFYERIGVTVIFGQFDFSGSNTQVQGRAGRGYGRDRAWNRELG